MIDADELVEYNGTTMKIRDIPDRVVRGLLGMGHLTGVKWRVSVPSELSPYPYSVEDCLRADETRGVWVLDRTILICQGCGLDCT